MYCSVGVISNYLFIYLRSLGYLPYLKA